MNRQTDNDQQENNAPKALIKPGYSFSIIWVVPIVALLIGGWLALMAWSEQGPVVKIFFETAEGLEADKTKIRFKDVEVGKVVAVELSDDLEGVVVTAEMNKSISKYMRDKTQFWVVRARVAAGEVSGLGTLFSGAYIGCKLSAQGEETNRFVGLEKPPPIMTDVPGKYYVLQADHLGSLDIGSPVYYRGIKVGQVVEYAFDDNAESIKMRVFINSPFDKKVSSNTRFWNASGVDLQVNTEGVKVDAQSLVSILLGGVAFDLPSHLDPGDEAVAGHIFRLFENHEKVEERFYSVKRYYMMYFDQNVRGLLPGAPVEIKGIRVGDVVDITLEVDAEKLSALVAVLVKIEPERIASLTEKDGAVESAFSAETNNVLARLVRKGLRAQLKSGNLLTGQLYVDLDFFEDVEPQQINTEEGFLVIPTLPASLEQIEQRVNDLLKKFSDMPIVEISQDLHEAIKTLNETLQKAGDMAGGINTEILPELKMSLEDFQSTLEGFEKSFGPESELNYSTRRMMQEFSSTIRSLKMFIDSVERDPQSFIFGREAEK